MFELLIWFVAIIFFAVKGYDIVLSCLMNWHGMSKLEAENTIHRWANKTARYDFTLDRGFQWDIRNAIENVIGEQRLKQLLDLGNTQKIYDSGIISGLPSVAICLFYADDNEKQRLEAALRNVVETWLRRFDCDTRILTDWRNPCGTGIPCLELHFARSVMQTRILNNILALNRKKIIARNSDVIDDTEDVDLFG